MTWSRAKKLKKGDKIELKELANALSINVDRLRGHIEEWKRNGDVEVSHKVIYVIKPGRRLIEYKTLPEIILLKEILEKGKLELEKAREEIPIKKDDFNPALAIIIKNGLAKIEKAGSKSYLSIIDEEKVLDYINRKNSKIHSILEKGKLELENIDEVDDDLKEMIKRPGILEMMKRKIEFITFLKNPGIIIKSLETGEIRDLTRDIIISGEWRRKKLKEYDVRAVSYSLYSGKKHPLRELIQEIREIFFEMGFEEVSGPIVETAFVNFDMLFQPQDHPARDMQDTFYLKDPYDKGEIPFPEIIDIIKAVHENGGSTGSKGWRYKWDLEEAKKLILRTHTTAVTIRNLYLNRDRDTLKLFSIGKVFRNETIDYKHLTDFMQVDGILMDKRANLRLLMGLLETFFKKLGAEKVKFWPTYFPFTEPSIQPTIFSDKMGEWVELGGAGIFRPEITEPLGIKHPVLAWGLGLERIIIIKYGIEDIREIYFNKLSWLRKRVL